MWRDIFLANKDAVLEMLGTFTEDLSTVTRAIRRGDGDTLFDIFTQRRAIRRSIPPLDASNAEAEFKRRSANVPEEPLARPYAAED
jgi:cyclohexadieny/prephenate dehydrogenase